MEQKQRQDWKRLSVPSGVSFSARFLWLPPVILATQEAEIRRIKV
jgi:hypothetical protein